MLKRNLWKIAVSLFVLGWAIFALLPLKDIPFPAYVRSHATAKQDDFNKIVDRAVAMNKSGAAPSVYIALKRIGNQEKIDLSQYFPNLPLEATLKNVSKRNDILLKYLLDSSKARLQLGLDLVGGVGFTLEADLGDKTAGFDNETADKEKLSKAIEIISARINSFGVSEPLIRAVGKNRIEVQLPGINTKDNPEVLNEVKKPARLDFRMVYPFERPENVPGGQIPPGYEIKSYDHDLPDGTEVSEEYFIKRIPEMTGDAIAYSTVQQDSYGNPQIGIRFTPAGHKRFAEVTKEIAASGDSSHLGEIAVVLDGTLCSVATVKEEIDSDQAVIEGHFAQREALTLANDLNNPLDVPLVVKSQFEVGPSLAEDAVKSGVRASVIGLVVVALFMVTFYTTGGVVAVITLGINLIVILGVMANIGATMTLPGLAGIVLTIGMAVDANILIFERMREELAMGKSLSSANQSGYSKALMTIIDAHIVQLIICAIMIWLGTGPIRGFGVTLAIGVLSTMFTVLVTAHLIMELLIESEFLKKFSMRHLIKAIHVDFVKFGAPAAAGSFLLVLIGLGVVFYRGNKIFGIDFSGGDVVTLQYTQHLEVGAIRQVSDAAKVGDINVSYESALGGGGEQLKVETPEGRSQALVDALQKSYPQAGFTKVGEEHVGASIGREILYNAARAIGASMLVILLYIAFRFEFGFGVGAMVSILHDIAMTIGIFVLFGHKFSAPMVAAILCIAGYSINETVVVFDRIREELKMNPTGSLKDIINSAINKVFARTIMTSSTTFLAALSLYLFGSGVLRDISFTFLVGIVTSTFSAIFIASQIFYWWHKGDRKHVEAHSDVAPKYEWTGSSKASQ
ncbi:MAG TPA: protein translocase subunit SecD [Opitutaceae bacterium]